MKNATKKRWKAFAASAMLLACWIVFPSHAQGQSQGQNVVYDGTTQASQIGSWAYVDASTFSPTSDICFRIYTALTSIPSGTGTTGAVIDARGINSGLTCPSGKTPWSYTTTVTTPATILLPARTILINTGWTLPNNTRIVGVGGGANNSAEGVTTIQACKSGVTGCSAFSGTMISMGSSSTTYCPSNVCNGVSVENIWLDGQNQNVTGISNSYAAEQSYVKHVTLYQITGPGLSVTAPTGSGTPQNSGPYQDISCMPGASAVAATLCAKIQNVGTRGIHGMSCINTSSTIPTTAIALDAPNNSIEDVNVQGFEYGIRLGASYNASNNLLKNITGGTGMTSAVIFISGAHTETDVTILGASNGEVSGVATIQDSHATPNTTVSDTTVAMYVIGEAVTSGSTTLGYSRFTTSPSAPTWGNGNASPTNTSACLVGSLYSNTQGKSGSNDTWWVCAPVSTYCATANCWTNIN
jgi:hypothetical protein